MTLSARIPVEPSRRLALLSVVMPIGGVLVAASTMVARWPHSTWPVMAAAFVACCAISALTFARLRHVTAFTLVVSQHADFDLHPDPFATEGTWRLAESTLVWPGFSMLALRRSDPSISRSVMRLGLLDAELASGDRRSLSRFLLWSLRGGDSRPFGDSSRP